MQSSYHPPDQDEYESISFQIIVYVLIGLGIALLFDRFNWQGYLPEGLVRMIAGSADTFGLTFAAIGIGLIAWLRQYLPRLPDLGRPKALTWILGGLAGLVLAFGLQALIFALVADPHGPIGVIYAFGFSNLDNTMAGLLVLYAVLRNHGREGWRRYWQHPFFVGNALMLSLIFIGAILARVIGGFRPDLNIEAGLEAGIMDLDSVGAALIYILATRVFKVAVPEINPDLSRTNRTLV